MDVRINKDWFEALSSSAPVPGGGGASALAGAGAASLRETIKLFWTIRVPWGWTYTAGTVPDWIAQYSFGLYSLMLTSLLIGLIVMVFYKPRSWCAFCPMGTMTQGICRIRAKVTKSQRS